MQIVKALVKSQQFALKELGLYSGPVDGVWSPQAAQAQMGLIYRDGGHQTHGQPFSQGNRLPRGLVWAVVDGQPVVAIQDAKEQDGGAAFLARFKREASGKKEAQKPEASPEKQNATPANKGQQPEKEEEASSNKGQQPEKEEEASSNKGQQPEKGSKPFFKGR